MVPVTNLAIFDLDGTLLQTSAVDDDCYAQAMADVFGIRGMSSDWGSYTHSTDGAILGDLIRQRLGREPTDLDVEAQRSRFVELLALEPAARFAPTPGAATVVDVLRADGWVAAIATGGWERSARLKLARAGVDVGELAAAFADDALSREAIIRTAAARASERHGATAVHVAYVGDGPWDVRAARALGIGFVGVARDDRAARLRAAGAAVVLPDFIDAAALRRALHDAAVPIVDSRIPMRDAGS